MNAENIPEILKSSRGGDILHLEGYLYTLNKHVKDKYYWECRHRNKRKEEKASCYARTVTRTDGDSIIILENPGTHLHAPDSREVDEIKLKNAIKRKALSDTGSPARIARAAAADLPAAIQVKVSSNAQRKIVHRTRRQSISQEEGSDEYEVPESLRCTLDGSKFFQECINTKSGKALLFAAHDDLRRLSLARFWIADGTFDTVPGCFRQLFTIHASVGPEHLHSVPVVYVLMSNKTENLYKVVLAKVSEVASSIDVELAPRIILTDYEKAMLNAFSFEYPEAEQKGCYFHLTQNLWKHVQQNGLVPLFTEPKTKEMASTTYNKLKALAFCPASDIPGIFTNMKNDLTDCMTSLVDYYEEFYCLGRLKPGKSKMRYPPSFPPSLWSVFDSTKGGIPRTTNNIESWHSRWSHIVGAKHVGTTRLVEEMRQEQKAAQGRTLVFLACGGQSSKTDFSLKNEKLKQIVSNYEQYETNDYINAVVNSL